MLLVIMKKILLVTLGLVIAVNIAFAQKSDEVVQLSEPVESGEDYEVYGAEFPDDAQFFALGYLIRNSNIFQEQEIATSGTIKQVCQKKGCFFLLTDGENEARITFKDYEFFIPTNSAGNMVRLVGEFKVNELSEEKARHYAEDANKRADGISGAKTEYNIVATSVKILN